MKNQPKPDPLFEQYSKSAAPRNGVSFEIYSVLVRQEQIYPPSRPHIETTRGDKPYHMVTYDGTSAEWPRRSFWKIEEAKAYLQQVIAAFGEASPTIKKGTPATLMYPDDRRPLVVFKVSPQGEKITLRKLKDVSRITGHKPADTHNGFPVWDHVYTEKEIEDLETTEEVVAYRHDNGWYYAFQTVPVYIGRARYRRDFSD